MTDDGRSALLVVEDLVAGYGEHASSTASRSPSSRARSWSCSARPAAGKSTLLRCIVGLLAPGAAAC